MSPAELKNLVAAPDLVVVDLVDHSRHALRLALLAEHPHLDDDSSRPRRPARPTTGATVAPPRRGPPTSAFPTPIASTWVRASLSKWDQPDLPF